MITVRKIATVRSAKGKKPAASDDNTVTNPIKDKVTEETVYMYGDIGGFFGIDHLEFVKEFNDIDAGIIHLRIDSNGGDVFAARAMKTAILQHKAKVIAHIDGIAASAASFVAMGADEIEIVDGGFIMIHNAESFMDVFGYFSVKDLEDLQNLIGREITLHGKINDSIATDYVKKTGKDIAQVLAWMSAETWFTAEEALENNFVDRVFDGEPVEASYDLSIYANTPEILLSRNKDTSKRMIENALRDVGLSNKEAKAVLAGAFTDKLRDEVKVVDGTAAPKDQRDVGTGDAIKDKSEKDKSDNKLKDKTEELLNRRSDIDKAAELNERFEALYPSE